MTDTIVVKTTVGDSGAPEALRDLEEHDRMGDRSSFSSLIGAAVQARRFCHHTQIASEWTDLVAFRNVNHSAVRIAGAVS